MDAKPITILGLSLAILGIFVVNLILKFSLLDGILSEQNLIITGQILIWLVGLIVFALVKWGEKQPLASIGFRSISWKEILFAVVLGTVLSLLVPVLTLLVNQIIPSSGDGDITSVTSSISWGMLLFSVVTAGIVEEFIFRGFLVERLYLITQKYWIAIVVSLIAFVLPHAFSWNITHVIGVVLPLGLILSGLYIWKRNLIFNMIVHFMIDLPLVVMALMAN